MAIVTESAVEYGENKLETSKAVSFNLSLVPGGPMEDEDELPGDEEFLAENTGEKHVVGGDGGFPLLGPEPADSSSLPPSPIPKPNSNNWEGSSSPIKPLLTLGKGESMYYISRSLLIRAN